VIASTSSAEGGVTEVLTVSLDIGLTP